MNTQIDHKQMFFKPGISPTSINQFFQSPLHFWSKSSYNPNRIKEPPTEAMVFGRLTHMLLLTPQDFEKEFAVVPDKSSIKGRPVVDTTEEMKALLDQVCAEKPDFKYTKSAKKAELELLIRENCPQAVIWNDELYRFNQTVGRRDAITKEQHDKAKAMIEAALSNPSVKMLLGNGCAEEPVTWYREEGGLLCKAKVDYLRNGLWIDYKTSYDVDNGHVDESNPDPQNVGLAKVIGSLGYHRQAAWGMDGIERVYGERPRGAVIIAQDKSLPEAVSVSALTTRALTIGAQENAWAYDKIKARLKSGQWPAYHQNLRGVDLPRWYKSPADGYQPEA